MLCSEPAVHPPQINRQVKYRRCEICFWGWAVVVMSCFSWPGEWVASPLLRSALRSLWLNLPDNVTCWLVFLREPLSVEANWSRTVSEFHRLTGFFSTIESLFLTPGGGGSEAVNSSNLQRGVKQFVIVNVVDQSMIQCAFQTDSDVNFMSLWTTKKSLMKYWLFACGRNCCCEEVHSDLASL